MRLRDRLQSDLMDAMRKRDETRRDALRMAITAVKNAEVEAGGQLDDEAVQRLLQREIKQRRESIAEFTRANRSDLVAREEAEVDVLQGYLPEQLSRDELVAIVRRVIEQTGATSPRDMGKVMPKVIAEVRGRAEGREVNQIVQAELSQR